MNGQRHAQRGDPAWSRGSTAVAGILLIGLGVVLLAVNTFGLHIPFDLGQIGWPVFILVPGLILLAIGLVTRGDSGEGLTVSGGIVTTIGAILAYSAATDHWTSWAYSWALIAPTSVGVSLTLWGALHGRSDVVGQGVTTTGIGLVLFVLGFAFFEGVLHIGDDQGLVPLGLQLLPIGLIAIGALIIFGRMWTESRKPPPPVGPWRPSYPQPDSPFEPTYPPAYPPAPQPAFPPPTYMPPPPPPTYQPTPLPPELDPRIKPEPNPWQLPDSSPPDSSPPESSPPPIDAPKPPPRVSSDEETTA